jgi:hypothetical protein
MLLWMWFLNVWDNVPMDLKYVCQQNFTCMCVLGFIRYNNTFIACGFRKYENQHAINVYHYIGQRFSRQVRAIVWLMSRIFKTRKYYGFFSSLSTHHYRVISKIYWLGSQKIFLGVATYLNVDCCYSKLSLWTPRTICLCFITCAMHNIISSNKKVDI